MVSTKLTFSLRISGALLWKEKKYPLYISILINYVFKLSRANRGCVVDNLPPHPLLPHPSLPPLPFDNNPILTCFYSILSLTMRKAIDSTIIFIWVLVLYCFIPGLLFRQFCNFFLFVFYCRAQKFYKNEVFSLFFFGGGGCGGGDGGAVTYAEFNSRKGWSIRPSKKK